MNLIYLKSALKCDSFDVAIDIKILFFRVLVTIQPGRSLLQFVTTNCLIWNLGSRSRALTMVLSLYGININLISRRLTNLKLAVVYR